MAHKLQKKILLQKHKYKNFIKIGSNVKQNKTEDQTKISQKTGICKIKCHDRIQQILSWID